MAHRIITLIFLLFLFNSNAQKPNTKIKSKCYEYYENFKNKKLDLINFSSTKCEYYNRAGKILKETVFNGNGSFDYENCYTYKYNSDNKRVKKISYTAKGNTNQIEIYKYNTKNHLIELLIYNNDSTLLSKTDYTYKYDLSDNILQETSFTKMYSDTEMSYRNHFTYDYFGNILEHIHKSNDGKQLYRINYTYNNSGYLLTKTRFDKNDQLEQQHTYRRGSSGKKLELHYKSSSLDEWTKKWEYDKNENKTKFAQYNSKMELEKKVKYFYDEKNRKNKEKHYNLYEKIVKIIDFKVKNIQDKVIHYSTYTDEKITSFTKLIIDYK
jgi:hypothetical protein